jgi:hypothetical protein
MRAGRHPRWTCRFGKSALDRAELTLVVVIEAGVIVVTVY